MNIINYIGKFHPLAVHLPIGILVLFLVVGVFVSRENLKQAHAVVKIILLVSALSATVSSVSGYLLANTDSYDIDLVTRHQVLGIALTIFNWLLFFGLNYLYTCRASIFRVTLLVVLILVVLTGHAGGSLTHGSEFLNPPPMKEWLSMDTDQASVITMESTAFEAAEVIFQEKCIVCHGKNKQKGSLRLDSKEHLLKGGEGGKLFTDDPSSSLLIQRILLPLDDEDHMPPKEKKQLSQAEVDYLIWWIGHGTRFETKLVEMPFPDSLQGILTQQEEVKTNYLIPEKEIQMADEKSINLLRSLDVIVNPIGSNSNFLSANFVNVLPENLDNAVGSLKDVKEQLIWLNMDYQVLKAEAWGQIRELMNLRKLSIKDSNLDDSSLMHLNMLKDLGYLNIVNTNVSYAGLEKISDLNNLQKLFLYQSKVGAEEIGKIQQLFPTAEIDFGNYQVPILESDTTVFRKEAS